MGVLLNTSTLRNCARFALLPAVAVAVPLADGHSRVPTYLHCHPVAAISWTWAAASMISSERTRLTLPRWSLCECCLEAAVRPVTSRTSCPDYDAVHRPLPAALALAQSSFTAPTCSHACSRALRNVQVRPEYLLKRNVSMRVGSMGSSDSRK